MSEYIFLILYGVILYLVFRLSSLVSAIGMKHTYSKYAPTEPGRLVNPRVPGHERDATNALSSRISETMAEQISTGSKACW